MSDTPQHMRAQVIFLIASVLGTSSVNAFKHLVEIRLPSKNREIRHSKSTSRSPLQEFLQGKILPQNQETRISKREQNQKSLSKAVINASSKNSKMSTNQFPTAAEIIRRKSMDVDREHPILDSHVNKSNNDSLLAKDNHKLTGLLADLENYSKSVQSLKEEIPLKEKAQRELTPNLWEESRKGTLVEKFPWSPDANHPKFGRKTKGADEL